MSEERSKTPEKQGEEEQGETSSGEASASSGPGASTRVDASFPPVRVHHPHVEVRDDLLAGSPCVRGTRVPVRRLWDWHRKGVTVETLCKRYSALTLAQILSALAFAYDNEPLVLADHERERALLYGEGARVVVGPPRRAP